MKTLRILHISDLHWGYPDYQSEYFKINQDLRSRVLEQLSATEEKVDFIVFSGDLTDGRCKDDDKPRRNQEAIQWLNEVREIILKEKDNGKRVIMSPGNHDFLRKKQNNAGRRESLFEVYNYFGKKKYKKDLDAYCHYLDSYRSLYGNKQAYYCSKLFRVHREFEDEYNVVFISINSNWFVGDSDGDLGKLFIDNNHFLRRANISDDCIVISVVHHPQKWFNPLENFELSNFFGSHKRLREISNLILSGHEHPTKTAFDEKQLPEITTGKLFFDKDFNSNPFYRIYTIKKSISGDTTCKINNYSFNWLRIKGGAPNEKKPNYYIINRTGSLSTKNKYGSRKTKKFLKNLDEINDDLDTKLKKNSTPKSNSPNLNLLFSTQYLFRIKTTHDLERFIMQRVGANYHLQNKYVHVSFYYAYDNPESEKTKKFWQEGLKNYKQKCRKILYTVEEISEIFNNNKNNTYKITIHKVIHTKDKLDYKNFGPFNVT